MSLTSKWFSMAGRRALITGASMSIGRSIALGFADHGASVAVHHSADADAKAGLPDAARATLDDVRARGVDGCLVESDLAVEGGGRHAVELAIERLGAVDVLVVCASIQFRTPFLQLTPEQIEKQLAVNFRATARRGPSVLVLSPRQSPTVTRSRSRRTVRSPCSRT